MGDRFLCVGAFAPFLIWRSPGESSFSYERKGKTPFPMSLVALHHMMWLASRLEIWHPPFRIGLPCSIFLICHWTALVMCTFAINDLGPIKVKAHAFKSGYIYSLFLSCFVSLDI